MESVDELAKMTMDNYVKIKMKDDKKGDILLTLAIFRLIIQMISVAWGCWRRTPATTMAKVRSPTIPQKVLLLSMINKILKRNGMFHEARNVLDALIETGKMAPQQTVMNAIIEAHADKSTELMAAEYNVKRFW